jgi:phage terminase large subunit GpA-like protein
VRPPDAGARQDRHAQRREWRATAEGQDPHTIGFHISALNSPVGWLSWAQIARDWEAAQGKPEDSKTFKNTVLGETWQESGEAPWAADPKKSDPQQAKGGRPAGDPPAIWRCRI